MKIHIFELSSFWEYDWKKFKPFSSDFWRILTKVIKYVELSSFYLSKKDIQHVFNSVSRIECLNFSECYLETEGVRFSQTRQFKITKIEFSVCLNYYLDGKDKHLRKFEDLVKAFSLWKLSTLLEKLIFLKYKLETEEVKTMLKTNNLENVEIENRDD